jgi:[acyl-carrier-protein] S-malonyltransferase
MVSILGLERPQVESLCERARGDEVLQLANLLCPGNYVVSGHKTACERVTQLAEAAEAMKVIPLAVAGAFHTPLMQPALEQLATALAAVEIGTPRIPVVSNVDSRPHQDRQETGGLLLRQLVNPVMWEDSMRWLMDQFGIEQFYEIGPGRVLRGLLKRIDRKMPCENVEG